MTVQETIDRLSFLVEAGHIDKNDDLLVLGSGNRCSDLVINILMPKIELDSNIKKVSGFYHLGVCEPTKELDSKFFDLNKLGPGSS